MPVLDPNMQSHLILGSTYGFSGVRMDTLGATQYTLAALVADVSGSVAPFLAEMERCLSRVVAACQRSPRADNLLLRTVVFDSALTELHGFKPLAECAPDAYVGALQAGGATALYDAAFNAVESVRAYGERLIKNGFSANGIVFVLTDGEDNTSSCQALQVKEAIAKAVSDEHLESLTCVLIGVGQAGVRKNLRAFAKAAGFTSYVDLPQADEKTLAKLADFFSRSIAVTSLALGRGRAAPSLTF